MTVYVFLGPTLDIDEARGMLDAEYLPPVSQGDVCRVAKDATAIGIIDGHFQHVPGVWHKEILWAMSQGVRVFGASSVGALRAAELSTFGMVGVGWIYEAFRAGLLADDDEVATAPGKGAERPSSEAMVNIRRTLGAATLAGVVGANLAATLTGLAKQLHYADRSYPRLFKIAAQQALPAAQLAAQLGPLERWIAANRVDQQRDDAIAMLGVLREQQGLTPADRRTQAAAVSFGFECTQQWQRLLNRVQIRASPAPTNARDAAPTVDWQATMCEPLLEIALHQHARVDDAALRETVIEFRRHAQLWEPEQLSSWLDDTGLSMAQFVSMMEDETKVRGMLEWARLESERLRPPTLAMGRRAEA